MNTTEKQLEIHQIIFETGDPEILLKGRVRDGILSYLTDIVINHSQLNMLLCRLMGIDGMPGSDQLFIQEVTFSGQIMHTADFSKLQANPLLTMDFLDQKTVKKVRA